MQGGDKEIWLRSDARGFEQKQTHPTPPHTPGWGIPSGGQDTHGPQQSTWLPLWAPASDSSFLLTQRPGGGQRTRAQQLGAPAASEKLRTECLAPPPSLARPRQALGDRTRGQRLFLDLSLSVSQQTKRNLFHYKKMTQQRGAWTQLCSPPVLGPALWPSRLSLYLQVSASQMDTGSQSQLFPPLSQLPPSAPGKRGKRCPNHLSPCAHTGNLKSATGSHLGRKPANGRSFCSLSLCRSAFQR